MFRKVLDSATAGDNVGLLLRGSSKEQLQARGDLLAGLGHAGSHVGHQPGQHQLAQRDDGGAGAAEQHRGPHRGPLRGQPSPATASSGSARSAPASGPSSTALLVQLLARARRTTSRWRRRPRRRRRAAGASARRGRRPRWSRRARARRRAGRGRRPTTWRSDGGDRAGRLDQQPDGAVLGRLGQHVVEGDRLGGVGRHPDRLDAGRRERWRSAVTTLIVARTSSAPGLASTSVRSPAPLARPSSRLVVAGSAWAGSQSWPRRAGAELVVGVDDVHRQPAPAGVHLERELARGAARSGRGRAAWLLLPGTETPRSAGTSSDAVGRADGDVGDGRAGVRVDQLDHRVVGGVRADRGEPLVGHRRRAVDRGERGRLRAARDQPGREVVGAGDHRRARAPAVRCDTRRVRTAQRCRPTCRARPGRRPSTFASGSAPRVLTPSRSDPVPGRAPGQTTDAEVSGVSTGACALAAGRGPGAGAAAPARTTTGSTIARSTSAPNRRLIAGPLPGRGRSTARTARGRPGSRRPAGPAARSAATTAARRGRSAESGRSTCQARVLRSSALACTSPAVASSAAATSPSAGAGSTTYSMPREASSVHGVRGRPRGQRLHQRR